MPNQALIAPSEGAFFITSPTAIIKGAKSPNAAKLFAQFMVSPAAQSMRHPGSTPHGPMCRRRPLSGIKTLPIDLDDVAAHNRDVKARFNETFQ